MIHVLGIDRRRAATKVYGAGWWLRARIALWALTGLGFPGHALAYEAHVLAAARDAGWDRAARRARAAVERRGYGGAP